MLKSQNPLKICGTLFNAYLTVIDNATAKSPGGSGIIPVGPAAVPVHHSSQDLIFKGKIDRKRLIFAPGSTGILT